MEEIVCLGFNGDFLLLRVIFECFKEIKFEFIVNFEILVDLDEYYKFDCMRVCYMGDSVNGEE